ncbi:RagB/SusD family nutrient uptake outer membrane protein [Niabella insulamsoli]|uniref:RagB/SusD family nutrient uptake outer membrane protein n=1 Tax=Niabella insulamsoli TaxID=3144874 RepID=UPI0031FD8012
MKKSKIFLLSLVVACLGMASCTKLDEELFSQLPAEGYYTDENAITRALVRIYEHGHWCGWDGDRWLLQELTADQFVWTQKGRHGYDDGQWVRLHGHNWEVRQGQINGSWVGPYQGIMQTLVIGNDIQNVDFASIGLTEADKTRFLSETRVLRAWFYLFLLDFFRKVPIIENPGESKPQSEPQEVFAYIEKELTEAIPNLPKNASVGRWDQAGAAALLVRLYLNAEKWIGTPKYTECATWAQDIIDGKYGNYSIDPDYRGPFRSGVAGYRSPENIFEFPHKLDLYNFGWMYNAHQHYAMRDALDNDWGSWNGIHMTPSRDLDGNLYDFKLGKPYEKYAATDKRKQSFRTTSASGDYEGFFIIGQLYRYDALRGYGYDSTRMINGSEEYSGKPLKFVDQVGRFSEKPGGRWSEGSHVTTGEENSGVRLLKFPWLQRTAGLFMANSAPEIRLAEIYYALAECKYRAGDKPGAATLIDAVKKRNFSAADWPAQSYAANIAKLTDDEFVDELGREFIGERHRRPDLIRWNRFGEAWWDKAADAGDKTVFPIPQQAIDANPEFIKPNGY